MSYAGQARFSKVSRPRCFAAMPGKPLFLRAFPFAYSALVLPNERSKKSYFTYKKFYYISARFDAVPEEQGKMSNRHRAESLKKEACPA